MKLVILDRDGVVNHDAPDYIKSAREWRPIAGSLEAIARLTHAGYRVVIASNQSGIGRGLFDYGDLFAIHDKLARMVGEIGGRVDGIFFCPHAPDQGCGCRKPLAGLLEDIGRRLQLEVAGAPLIGDSLADVEAARAVGASPILVRSGYGADTEREHTAALAGVTIYDDLAAAVDALLAEPPRPAGSR